MCGWGPSEQLSSDVASTRQRRMLAAEFVWLHVGKGWGQEMFREELQEAEKAGHSYLATMPSESPFGWLRR